MFACLQQVAYIRKWLANLQGSFCKVDMFDSADLPIFLGRLPLAIHIRRCGRPFGVSGFPRESTER